MGLHPLFTQSHHLKRESLAEPAGLSLINAELLLAESPLSRMY